MKKLLATALILTSSVASAQEITFPSDFFAERIAGKSCITKLHPYDEKDIAFMNADKLFENDTSLTVNHDELSYRWANILSKTYTAVASKDTYLAKEVVKTLVHIAENNALLSTKTNGNGNCWAGGDKNSKCAYHTKQHAGFTVIAMLYSGIILKEYMTAEEIELLDNYFEKAYKKFINPLATEPLRSPGIYEFADYGLGVLAYAHWTSDERLAKKEIDRRYKSFLNKIEKTGFIDNNSYRGNRGYWYHTLGAESVFSYALVAREFGYDWFTDSKMGPRLRALADTVSKGDEDYNLFASLPTRGNNASKDPGDARPWMHQLSISLPITLLEEYQINSGTHPKYLSLSKHETVNRFSGFNSACFYTSIR